MLQHLYMKYYNIAITEENGPNDINTDVDSFKLISKLSQQKF